MVIAAVVFGGSLIVVVWRLGSILQQISDGIRGKRDKAHGIIEEQLRAELRELQGQVQDLFAQLDKEVGTAAVWKDHTRYLMSRVDPNRHAQLLRDARLEAAGRAPTAQWGAPEQPSGSVAVAVVPGARIAATEGAQPYTPQEILEMMDAALIRYYPQSTTYRTLSTVYESGYVFDEIRARLTREHGIILSDADEQAVWTLITQRENGERAKRSAT